MAKSFTAINNDIANALRLNTLTKEAPHVIELNKLFETLEKLLKKPIDPILSEATLDEYYNKLAKITNMLNSLSKKEIIQSENPEDSLNTSSNNNTTQNTINQTPSKTIPTINTTSQKTLVQSQTPQKAIPSITGNTPSQVFQTPAVPSTTTGSATSQIFQTPASGNISSAVSNSPMSNVPASPQKSSTPANPKVSQQKKRLFNALLANDYTFNHDQQNQKVSMKGKDYDMSDFNSLYSKLRDGDSPMKKNTILNTSEKEMFDIIKNTLSQHNDGQKILNDLPGLKAFIINQTPAAVTRHKGRQQNKKLQNALGSVSSPVSTKQQRGGRPSQNKLTGTSGSGSDKSFGATKINFRRWEDFLK
jgi:hypothetical protein